jgi:hypothetical protein
MSHPLLPHTHRYMQSYMHSPYPSTHTHTQSHLRIIACCAHVYAAVRGPGQTIHRGMMASELSDGEGGVPAGG